MYFIGKDLKSCEKTLNSSYLTDEEKSELLRIMNKRGLAQEADGTVDFIPDNQGEKESDFVSSEEEETQVSTPSRAEKRSAAKAHKDRYSKSSKNAKKMAKSSTGATTVSTSTAKSSSGSQSVSSSTSKSSSGTRIVSISTPENKQRRRTPKARKLRATPRILQNDETVVTEETAEDSSFTLSTETFGVSAAYTLADKLRKMPMGLTEQQKIAKEEMNKQYDAIFQQKFNSLPSDKEK